MNPPGCGFIVIGQKFKWQDIIRGKPKQRRIGSALEKAQIIDYGLGRFTRGRHHENRDAKLPVDSPDKICPFRTAHAITINTAVPKGDTVCQGFKRIYCLILNHKQSNETGLGHRSSAGRAGHS